MRNGGITAARGLAVAAAAAVLAPATADAHKLNLFVRVEGKALRGEAYYSGRGRPKNVEVLVQSPDGKLLGRVRTDDRGAFVFAPIVRCDHRFVVDDGAGHRAEYVFPAADLPGSLGPLPAPASAPASRGSSAPASGPAGDANAAAPATTQALDELVDRLTGVLGRAVQRELDAHDAAVRIRDVIAGIGYIFGVMGVVMMLKYRRKARQADDE